MSSAIVRVAARSSQLRAAAGARLMGHRATLDFDPLALSSLTRVQLLELAKNHGQKTNMPSSEIIGALSRIHMMRSADHSFVEVAGAAAYPPPPPLVIDGALSARADAQCRGLALCPL
jgi:hypothetical protein